MNQNLKEVFQKSKYKAGADLSENIWQTISLRGRKTARLKSWAFALIGFVSFVGLIPSFKMLFDDLAQSGFYEYFSLIFSDSGTILSYWKEFIFSLAESLPTTSIIFTLSLLCVCFLSAKYLVRQINNGQLIGPAILSI